MIPAPYKNRIEIDVNDEHLAGIGRVALSWSTLESAVERIVWRLAAIENDQIGLSITTHTNIQTRLDAAQTLANLRLPENEVPSRIKKLDRYIRKQLMPRRNEIVHSRLRSHLFDEPQVALRIVSQARGKLKHGYVDVVPNDYDEVALAILGAATEARGILATVLNSIRTQDHAPTP